MVVEEVRCVHGANAVSLPISGRTAGWARANLRDALNLPYYAEALVHGSPVAQGYLLRGGDLLEFLDCDGFKGDDPEAPPEVLKARRLLQRYPELMTIGAVVKSMGLDADQAVDLALAAVARHMRRRFGPTPGPEMETLRVIAETVTRIEDRLSTGPDRSHSAAPLPIKEAAKALNLSESHIRRAVARGELPASNVGTAARPTWRIARADLDAWIESKKGGSPKVPPRSDLKDLIRRHLPGF